MDGRRDYERVQRLLMSEQVMAKRKAGGDQSSGQTNAVVCYAVDPDLSAALCILQAATVSQRNWMDRTVFTGHTFTLRHKGCTHVGVGETIKQTESLLDPCCSRPLFKADAQFKGLNDSEHLAGKVIGDMYNKQGGSVGSGNLFEEEDEEPAFACTPIVSLVLEDDVEMITILKYETPCVQIFHEIVSPWHLLRVSECVIEERVPPSKLLYKGDGGESHLCLESQRVVQSAGGSVLTRPPLPQYKKIFTRHNNNTARFEVDDIGSNSRSDSLEEQVMKADKDNNPFLSSYYDDSFNEGPSLNVDSQNSDQVVQNEGDIRGEEMTNSAKHLKKLLKMHKDAFKSSEDKRSLYGELMNALETEF